MSKNVDSVYITKFVNAEIARFNQNVDELKRIDVNQIVL